MYRDRFTQLLPRSTPLGFGPNFGLCQEGGGAQEKTETRGVLDGRAGGTAVFVGLVSYYDSGKAVARVVLEIACALLVSLVHGAGILEVIH